MDDIVSEFLIESYEGLDSLDEHLLMLEESPGDTAVVVEVFRTLHTIKGACGYLGFTTLERTAHAGESLLSLVRDGKKTVTPEVADALLATVDAIRTMVSAIDQTGSEAGCDPEDLIDRLKALMSEDDAGNSAEDDAGEPPAVPAVPAVAEGPDDAGNEFFFATPAEPAAEPADTEDPAPASSIAPADEPPRIGDLLVEAGDAERTDVEIAAAEQQLGDTRKLGKILVDDSRAEAAAVEAAAVTQRVNVADATIRVDVDLLNRLMNLVGELVLSRNQIVQLAAEDDTIEEFSPAAQRLNLITSELQEGVMKTRMQPINNVWGKLPRVVRDLSLQLGKKVRVEMIGKHTELDRTIIEAIKDPLTHIVRNTVDHGIETPEDRIAAGKDPEGVLTLRANHEGGQVNIEITDDGKGIPAEVIRDKAIKGGHLTAEQAARLSENEVVQLIFEAGLSTATKVSNVSGRGVGMDVVRTNIGRIGGTVDVRTKVGEGTTFKIKIPLTLAIIPALTVVCEGGRYAVPQMSVAELVRIDETDESHRVESLHGAPVLRLRGSLLPIVSMRELLGFEPLESESFNIVVLSADELRFGLVVDKIEDTEEIVVKPLGPQIKKIRLFSGATIMGDGRIALILDVIGLANEAGILAPASAAQSENGKASNLALDVINDRTMLLVRVGEQTRLAVPMRDVERLEEFPATALERSDGRPVVQYRGQIMPLVDLGQSGGFGESSHGDATRVSVIVYSANGLAVGLIVTEVLDIVSDAEPMRTIDDGSDAVVVDGQIVDVIDAAGVLSSALNITLGASAESDQTQPTSDSDYVSETVAP